MKISCMIIDDEPYAVDLVADYVSQLPYLELKQRCYYALEALQYLKDHQVDLIFVDINMPQISGIQLCNLFPAGQKFIFITAHAEFALESYDKNALDYLLKPIIQERFNQAANKAMELFKMQSSSSNRLDNEGTIYLKSGKVIIHLQYGNVMVVEGLRDYVLFHTADDKHIIHKRMKLLEETLPEIFSRVHNSYFVNRPIFRKYRAIMFISAISGSR